LNLIYQLDKIKAALYAASRNSDYDDGDFETKRTEINGLLNEVKTLNDNYYLYKCIPGNTDTEKIKKFLSDDDSQKPNITLEDVKTALEGIKVKFNLTDDEENTLKLINEAIEEPNKFKDAPTSDLTVDTLSTLFAFTADDNLLSS